MNILTKLLDKYLEKQGVQNFTELDEGERAVYEEWRAILTKELAVEDIQKFISAQLIELNKELVEAVKNGQDRKALQVTARLENYNDLIAVIAAPDRNREQLVSHINNLLNHE